MVRMVVRLAMRSTVFLSMNKLLVQNKLLFKLVVLVVTTKVETREDQHSRCSQEH